MQTTHTPGPWALSQAHGFSSGQPRNSYTISGVCGTGATTPNPNVSENEANARLIAAAPELLDALQSLLTLHIAHHNMPEHAAARAVIAKAIV